MTPQMPPHAFAGFDTDRLTRMARWRTAPGSTKDVIKCYAKVILSLSELHKAAVPLKLHPCIASSLKKPSLAMSLNVSMATIAGQAAQRHLGPTAKSAEANQLNLYFEAAANAKGVRFTASTSV